MEMRQARHALGMTRQEFCKALGLSLRMVDYIESGERPLQDQTKLAIECLLRRAGIFKRFNTVLNGAKANAKDGEG